MFLVWLYLYLTASFLQRWMTGGRARLKAGARKQGKPQKICRDRRGRQGDIGKAQGSPAAASVHRRIPTSLLSLQPACCSTAVITNCLIKATARLQTECITYFTFIIKYYASLSPPCRSGSRLHAEIMEKNKTKQEW